MSRVETDLRAAAAAFVTALAFFTRIPCPGSLIADESARTHAASFAPLVGWVVGLVAGLAYLCATAVFPTSIAVLAAVVVGVWITGGLHEDGLADFCDGFAVRRNRERTLAIMADPRSGAFAVLGVGLVLGARWVALVEIARLGSAVSTPSGAGPGPGEAGAWLLMGAVLITGHALSRAASVAFMFTHTYVRPEPRARGRHLSSPMSAQALGFVVLCGLAPLAVLAALGPAHAILAVLPVLVAWAALGRWFADRIGGYTGDCLGAAQQITELVFYLGVCAALFVGAPGA